MFFVPEPTKPEPPQTIQIKCLSSFCTKQTRFKDLDSILWFTFINKQMLFEWSHLRHGGYKLRTEILLNELSLEFKDTGVYQAGRSNERCQRVHVDVFLDTSASAVSIFYLSFKEIATSGQVWTCCCRTASAAEVKRVFPDGCVAFWSTEAPVDRNISLSASTRMGEHHRTSDGFFFRFLCCQTLKRSLHVTLSLFHRYTSNSTVGLKMQVTSPVLLSVIKFWTVRSPLLV